MCRYLKGLCEKTDQSCLLSHKITKEKVNIMQCAFPCSTCVSKFSLCRCQFAHSSYGVCVSEKAAHTFMSVLARMLISAWTLSKAIVQKGKR